MLLADTNHVIWLWQEQMPCFEKKFKFGIKFGQNFGYIIRFFDYEPGYTIKKTFPSKFSSF
jgi:hypothetical protein